MSPLEARKKAEYYIRQCSYVLDEEIDLSPVKEIRKQIISDQSQMRLYGQRNITNLVAIYEEEKQKLKRLLYEEDEESFILNILEYLRYTCAKEEYIGIPGVLFFEALDSDTYSSILIGKGTSSSQALFLQELIEDDNYQYTEVRRIDEANPYSDFERFSVLLKNGEYIDPYHYNGKDKIQIPTYHYSTMVREKEFDKYKAKKAHEKVTSYLIKKLQIDELIHTIVDSEDIESIKLEKIIEFIKNNYRQCDCPVNYYTATINGTRIEVSKLLELLLIEANIPYKISKGIGKENETLIVDLGEEKRHLNMYNILKSKDEKVYKKGTIS